MGCLGIVLFLSGIAHAAVANAADEGSVRVSIGNCVSRQADRAVTFTMTAGMAAVTFSAFVDGAVDAVTDLRPGEAATMDFTVRADDPVLQISVIDSSGATRAAEIGVGGCGREVDNNGLAGLVLSMANECRPDGQAQLVTTVGSSRRTATLIRLERVADGESSTSTILTVPPNGSLNVPGIVQPGVYQVVVDNLVLGAPFVFPRMLCGDDGTTGPNTSTGPNSTPDPSAPRSTAAPVAVGPEASIHPLQGRAPEGNSAVALLRNLPATGSETGFHMIFGLCMLVFGLLCLAAERRAIWFHDAP